MKVTCESCQKAINVPDEKIPPGKSITFACPSCKSKITASRSAGPEGMPDLVGVPDATPGGEAPFDETRNVQLTGSVHRADPAELAKMLDAVESEMDILEEGTKRALVADPANLDRITPVLRKLSYTVSTVKTVDEALKKLQFNFYNLIVVDERFDGSDPTSNRLVEHLSQMNMAVRRKMFVVVIGKNFKTLDNMSAFVRSANMVMNEADFSNFELILRKAMKENDTFYTVFKKALIDTGRELE
jgi:CheY-like chemotaxis protein